MAIPNTYTLLEDDRNGQPLIFFSKSGEWVGVKNSYPIPPNSKNFIKKMGKNMWGGGDLG